MSQLKGAKERRMDKLRLQSLVAKAPGLQAKAENNRLGWLRPLARTQT